MTFVMDDNLTVAPAKRHHLTDDQCHRARLTVAHHATNTVDLAYLLDVLGLTPGQEPCLATEDTT